MHAVSEPSTNVCQQATHTNCKGARSDAGPAVWGVGGPELVTCVTDGGGGDSLGATSTPDVMCADRSERGREAPGKSNRSYRIPAAARNTARAFRAASTVRSISASVWAALTNPASNCDGGQ